MRGIDVYKGLLEGAAISQILKLLGVRVAYRIVTDRVRLGRAVKEAKRKSFTVFHLSCHANRDGMELTSGPDLQWSKFAVLAGGRRSGTMLCLSACEAGNHAVAIALKHGGSTPDYIVGPESEPTYAQTCVAWSVFYHSLARKGISTKNMQHALCRMNRAVDTDFLYRRWIGEKYVRYPPATNDPHISGTTGDNRGDNRGQSRMALPGFWRR